MLCIICESESPMEVCQSCGEVREPPRLVNRGEIPDVRKRVPEKQLPSETIKTADLREYIEKVSDYVQDLRMGRDPVVPVDDVELTQTIVLPDRTYPRFKTPFSSTEGFQTYGSRLSGFKECTDLTTSDTLLVVDPIWDEISVEYKNLFSREARTVFLFTDIEKHLFGEVVYTDPLFLVDEDNLSFTTAGKEIVRYTTGRVESFFRAAWAEHRPVKPFDSEKLTQMGDFLAYTVGLVSDPVMVSEMALDERPPLTKSLTLSQTVTPRENEIPATLSGFACLLETQRDIQATYAVGKSLQFTRVTESAQHKPSYTDFRRMSPSQQQSVGRVCIGEYVNTVFSAPKGVLSTPIVQIDSGDPALVKHESETHTTVFETNEEGPLLFSGSVGDEATGPLRAAVSYYTVENSRCKRVGTAYVVLYTEIDEAPYISSPRVMEFPGGLFVKIVEDQRDDEGNKIDPDGFLLDLETHSHGAMITTKRVRRRAPRSARNNRIVNTYYHLVVGVVDDVMDLLYTRYGLSDSVYVPLRLDFKPQFPFHTLGRDYGGPGADLTDVTMEDLA